MIVLVAVLALGQANAPENQIYADLGKKLALVGFQTAVDRGGHLKACTVTRSSGDAQVDRIFCDSLRGCLPEGTVETASTMTALTACTDATQKKMLRELAAERANAAAKVNGVSK